MPRMQIDTTPIKNTKAFFSNIRRKFLTLAKHVAQFKNNAKEGFRAMTTILKDLSCNPTSKPINTIKDRKPPEEMIAEAIHASSAWICARLASWTARALQQILQMIRRVTKTRIAFVNLLENSKSFQMTDNKLMS